MQKRRVDFHLVCQSETKLGLGGTMCHQRRPAEEDRGVGCVRGTVARPGGQTQADEECGQTLLLVLLPGLAVDTAETTQGVAPLVRSERRHWVDGGAVQQLLLVQAGEYAEIDSPGPLVAIEDQVVPPAQVDQLLRPAVDGSVDHGHSSVGVDRLTRVAHGMLRPESASASGEDPEAVVGVDSISRLDRPNFSARNRPWASSLSASPDTARSASL